MRVFVGFGGKEDGWYRLPDVYLCDAVTDAVAVRPAASEGKGLIVGLYGRLLREDGTPDLDWAPRRPDRAYTLQGAPAPTGPWATPTPVSRFFRLSVDLAD